MGHRFFVTATDTGVGKTEIATALLRAMVTAKLRPYAFKPFESGWTSDEKSDSERLRRAAGSHQSREDVVVYRFRQPLAPAAAARQSRTTIRLEKVMAAYQRIGRHPCVVEGAGGLFVPLTSSIDVVDLVERLKLPTIVVARAGLGTINHTTLTLNELARRRIEVPAVFLVHSQPVTDSSIRLNQRALKKRFPSIRFVRVQYMGNAQLREIVFERMVRWLLK